ncbi:UNKNOWN [Stylonychia lemnae]|uniref:Uncharacterized protein n=1 Tax=Stylonychia lemnae TaxID=5949 RepID=A0A078ANH9_STYLE|nr:UNKNOWN [Stylonychia lemnae]|eukprot:CDW82523.1 UNKNOWN [Stylonychia lemnae]
MQGGNSHRPVSPLRSTQLPQNNVFNRSSSNDSHHGIAQSTTPTQFSLQNLPHQMSRDNSQSKIRLSDIIRQERKQMQETSSLKQLLIDHQVNQIVNQKYQDDNKENFLTSLDQIQGTFDNNLIYSPTEQTQQQIILNKVLQDVTYKSNNISQADTSQTFDNSFKNYLNPNNEQRFLSNHQETGIIQYQNNSQNNIQNQLFMNSFERNPNQSHNNTNINYHQNNQVHDVSPLRQEFESRYHFERSRGDILNQDLKLKQQSNSYFQNDQLSNSFVVINHDLQPQLRYNYEKRSIDENQNQLMQSNAQHYRSLSQPQTNRHYHHQNHGSNNNDSEQITIHSQQPQTMSINQYAMRAGQAHNQSMLNSNYIINDQSVQHNISQYNPVDESSSLYEYTQDYASKKNHQHLVDTQQPQQCFQKSFSKLDQSPLRLQASELSQKIKKQSDYKSVNEQYLIKELEFMKKQHRDLEELHQNKLIESEQELQKKEKYITKLERHVKESNQISNQKQSELQDKLRELLKEQETKDIIDHVNLFETLSSKKTGSDIYELLKIIIDKLFKKIKSNRDENIDQKILNLTTTTQRQDLITNQTRSMRSFDNQQKRLQNYREPQIIEAELNDCQRKLKDLELLIQVNKSIQPSSMLGSQSSNNLQSSGPIIPYQSLKQQSLHYQGLEKQLMAQNLMDKEALQFEKDLMSQPSFNLERTHDELPNSYKYNHNQMNDSQKVQQQMRQQRKTQFLSVDQYYRQQQNQEQQNSVHANLNQIKNKSNNCNQRGVYESSARLNDEQTQRSRVQRISNNSKPNNGGGGYTPLRSNPLQANRVSPGRSLSKERSISGSLKKSISPSMLNSSQKNLRVRRAYQQNGSPNKKLNGKNMLKQQSQSFHIHSNNSSVQYLNHKNQLNTTTHIPLQHNQQMPVRIQNQYRAK